MDALVPKTKEIFPGSDDAELDAMLTAVRQSAPNADDETILKVTKAVKDEHDKTTGARNYVKEKYGIADRQKIVDQNEQEASGGNAAAAFAALGAGLAGRDATSAGQAVLNNQQAARDSKLANFDKARDLAVNDQERAESDEKKLARKDPNSELSKQMQQMAVEDYGMNPETAAKIPAEVLEARLPALKYKAERADKDRELAFKEKELNTKIAGDTAKNGAKLSDGQKAVDKDYAKDYNNWTSGGKNMAEASVAKLKGVVDRLKEGKGGTGGSISGLRSGLPGLLQDSDFQKNDADVRSEALKLIKQNLAGATSDKDVERTVSTLWNPSDSTENNLARVESFLGTVEKTMADNDAKARNYEKYGSLQKYEGKPADTQMGGGFPRTIRKDGKTATVSNQAELDEALGEGWS